MKPFKVWGEVYQIGGSELSHSYDCSIYLLNVEPDLVLIDSGAGKSFRQLVKNIESLGFAPQKLRAIIVTHSHIDHIGALADFKESFGAEIVAHELDAGRIEEEKNASARAYGLSYKPCKVDLKLKGGESLKYGAYEIKTVHIPGHTPGSIACYVDMAGKRVLFGQDIHGPYNPEWGADVALAAGSLQKLIDLEADILCEGHFGIYQPASQVREYIKGYSQTLR